MSDTENKSENADGTAVAETASNHDAVANSDAPSESTTVRSAVAQAIRKRPLLSVIVPSLLALLLGLGIGSFGGHHGDRPFGGPNGGIGMHHRDGRFDGDRIHGPMMNFNGQGNQFGPGPMMGPNGQGGPGFGPDGDRPFPGPSGFPNPSATPQNQ